MDTRGGGCCIARYGGYGGPYGLSKADRIMLRFRPIAPKPANNGELSSQVAEKYGGSTTITTSGGSSDLSGKSGRGKRKYLKESSRCTRRKRSENKDTTAVTLSLLPETPEKRDLPDLNAFPVEKKQKRNGPLWLSFNGGGGEIEMLTPCNKPEISRRKVIVSSCVTVEHVTDAWIDGYELGKTDEERKMNMMNDTCPCIISDGLGRVTWTNEAYKKMAIQEVNVPEISYDNFHVIVRLVMKERPMLTYPAITCRVRLQYTCQDRERGSVTLPCDVWRMDGGGFAWRLDVKAALCL